VNADFAGVRELENKNRVKTAEENDKASKEAQDKLRKGSDVDVNNQVALRQAQTATTMAMDNLVQKGVGPVTAGMLKLATSVEKVVTGIPGTGAKTSVSARPGESRSGRGVNTPATAGYGTSWKPEDLGNFLNNTIEKAYGTLAGPSAPNITTGTQAHQLLTGNTPRFADTTRASTGITTGVQANNILQQAANGTNAGSNSNGADPNNSPDLTRSIMSLSDNIGLQTSSMNELVDLMRRSLGVQGRILQQSRN
jgi:hypothetical protein